MRSLFSTLLSAATPHRSPNDDDDRFAELISRRVREVALRTEQRRRAGKLAGARPARRDRAGRS